MSTRVHRMPFGAEPGRDGVRFRFWAPDAEEVTLLLEGGEQTRELVLPQDDAGWCGALVPEAAPGWRYRFRINGGLAVPDPASRFQPEDVHGPSEVVDPAAYHWTCSSWCGRPWEEVVLYELHVGTFTKEGTFRSAIEKLDYLVDLGVTAIELMPVADFPGKRDWGYDGVALFAPDAAYGRPEDMKALIDAAHARGLMVLLDVVYNHFGPEGNYLGVYAKRFFDPEKHTPWGAAIDFEGAKEVRRFFVENALYWTGEYAIDGLRFDAVHAIHDRSDPDILREIAAGVAAGLTPDRHVHLVLENDDNAARYLARDAALAPREYVAQWNDDIHHAFHVALTGESRGYYLDYADDPIGRLARCLTEGFAYQGEPSVFRAGEPRGEPSAELPPAAFVAFLQNHDQIGNRAFGDRLAALAPHEAVRAGLAVLLLSPAPPMLFMGEEWGSKRPFLFFCDLGGDLRDAVRDGRRREFATFPEFADPMARERIPDPTSPDAFLASKLDWSELDAPRHRDLLAETRRLLALRAAEIAPRLAGTAGGTARVLAARETLLAAEWTLGDGCRLTLIANLGALPIRIEGAGGLDGRCPLFATHDIGIPAAGDRLPPWSVVWLLGETTTEA